MALKAVASGLRAQDRRRRGPARAGRAPRRCAPPPREIEAVGRASRPPARRPRRAADGAGRGRADRRGRPRPQLRARARLRRRRDDRGADQGRGRADHPGDRPRRRARWCARCKTFPLLDGYRGAPLCDLDAIEDVLLRVSAMVEAHPEIAELDCNPLIAGPDGAVIVDARVRIEPTAPSRPMPSLHI